MKIKKSGFLLCIIAIVLAMSGCGSAKRSESSSIGSMDYDSAFSKESGDFKTTSGINGSFVLSTPVPEYSDASADLKNNAANTNQKLIWTYSLNVQTLEFDKLLAEVRIRVGNLGGYIESSSISGNGYNSGYDNRNSNMTIRIPNDKAESFVNQMGELANVTYQHSDSKDVTLSYLDMESRLKTLQVQHERLLALLEKASSIDNIIELEKRLSDVLYEIEYYNSQLRNYDNLIEYSTVTLNISEVKRIAADEDETVGKRIAKGFSDTLYDISNGFQDFLVGFVSNLPYIIFWGAVITVAVIIIVKRIKKLKISHSSED